MSKVAMKRGIILMLFSILQTPALSAEFSGGIGEPNDPYQIATVGDLILLGESPEHYDKHFILTADIDLDPNLPGRKIFKKGVIASETYDTSRWGIDGTSFIGVFDGNGHTISHLTITGAGYLGLFRQLGTGAKISNLGLIAVDVNGSNYCAGGLVSRNNGGSIISCYSTGKVSGDYNVGGLVGENTGSISSSYSTCVVKGSEDVGGLVGENDGSIASSYSTGSVSGNRNTGGLAGDDLFGHTISSFWDVETSGQATSAGGTDLTTVEMQDINTFLNAGWDFVDETFNGTCDYWQISPGDYPQLKSNFTDSPAMLDGLGTAQHPYLIRDARDLGTVWIEPMAHYRLEASVDLSGIKWSMAVVPWFGGTFDGNGHVISNLHIQGGEYLGLFGQLGSGAIISNLGLEAVDVNGVAYAGGLAGINDHGRIISSYSTGNISGDYSVGGLVGLNTGSITSSYSSCVVIGKGRIGGLVGENEGNITASYCTGKVTSKTTGVIRYTGGLVGINDYGDIVLSFWDVETSGQETSAGGTGLTTNEMQDINTFLNAGWDFVGENFNGTCDYWHISSGDYPQLRIHSGDSPSMPEGLGTEQQPYLIRDALDLGTMWIKPRAHYRLETSLDLSEIKWSMAVVPWFEGTFDGNGHVISNLHIQGHEYLGLFGKLEPGAIISNLGLDTVDINGTADYVGGLVGYNYKGRIVTSFSTGTISGDCFVGGLVGNSNSGSITSCYSTGTIIGDVNAGGLVGHNWYGSIDTSFSTVTIGGNENIGGLVGQNWHGSIDTSFSTGTVSGDNKVGGLVGDNSAGITNSYSTCAVNGDECVGGLVGENYRSSIISSYSTGTINGGKMYVGGLMGLNLGSMTACYSHCEVSGYSYVGGLAGRNEGNIAISYSTGKVTGMGWDAGGLVGYNYYGGITSSFWDIETSGQYTSDGGTGLTTADMQDIITFLNAGWDFVGETINGTCDYWQISSGDYPRLRSHSGDRPVMPEGLGTAQQPYLIRDAGDLGTVWFRPRAHYRLEESVDLSGITWSTAVIPWFGGIFDGNDHVISNLRIQGGEYQGLFGQLGSGANISNLGLDAVDVNGTADYVGGLVGYNYKGSIATSFSVGTVNGENYVGGLVGDSDHGSITSSYSTGTIGGHDNVGGLVGSNFYGSIDISSSTGTVSGDDDVGGLIGSNYEGSIISSYSIGSVSGDDNVGGLSGYNEYGSINSSYSTCLVTGNGENVGGLVGSNNWLGYIYYGLITASYSTGAVSGDKNVGGLVGENFYSSIVSSYSTGSVRGNQCVGGLVGVNWRGYITMSYSIGAVKGDSEIGGLAGSGGLSSSQPHGTAICFWDTQTSGQATSSAGIGKTTNEMQTAGMFLDAGWDFVDETENGIEDTWWILEGRGYPRLWWEAEGN